MTAPTERARTIGAAVEAFVRHVVAPYESDPRRDAHGPSDALVDELRGKARAAGVLTPHILPDGTHLTQRETAYVLRQSGLSPLGPIAVNTATPDEGNMYLLGKVGSDDQKRTYLTPLARGEKPKMDADQSIIYDFTTQMLKKHEVDDPTYARMKDRFGERGVLDVALACGFRQVTFFNRLFRREVGCTPTEYRRRHRRKGR